MTTFCTVFYLQKNTKERADLVFIYQDKIYTSHKDFEEYWNSIIDNFSYGGEAVNMLVRKLYFDNPEWKYVKIRLERDVKLMHQTARKFKKQFVKKECWFVVDELKNAEQDFAKRELENNQRKYAIKKERLHNNGQ